MKKYSLFVLFLLLIGSAFASDIAYIYGSHSRIDSNFVRVFEEEGFSIDYFSAASIPENLSSYKFIFIGDEYFSSDFPFSDYNLILANHFLGEKVGITDSLGISTMTSTESPKVTFKGSNVQVYDYPKDDSGIYIPYYFLSDSHKSSSALQYAGTYSTSSGKFGDVISFIDSGSLLENGEVSRGNICFFGITKSSHWTSGAEDLLLDCIDFVNTGSDSNETPQIYCYLNSDCGSDFFLDNFCLSNNVFRNHITFKCNNPGTSQSYCSNKTEPELVLLCNDYCSSGTCKNFSCSSNLDCDDKNSSTEDICLSPSSSNSLCTHKSYPVFCSSNLDCDDKNSSTEDICLNPGKTSSSCIYKSHTDIIHIRSILVSASPGINSVLLNFSTVLGNSSKLSGYYLSVNNKSESIFILPNESSYLFSNLSPSTDYLFYVRAVDNNNFSSEVNISTRTLDNPSGGGSSGGGSSSGSSLDESTSGRGTSLCITKWSCTDWSTCKDGNQVRSCYYPPEYCTPEQEKPTESRTCKEETVSGSGITNQTTFSSPENDTIKQGFSITGSAIGSLSKYPWLWIIIFFIVIGLLYLYVRKRRAAKKKK